MCDSDKNDEQSQRGILKQLRNISTRNAEIVKRLVKVEVQLNESGNDSNDEEDDSVHVDTGTVTVRGTWSHLAPARTGIPIAARPVPETEDLLRAAVEVIPCFKSKAMQQEASILSEIIHSLQNQDGRTAET